MMDDQDREYAGFEQGPIRPPSEAQSLLIRVTRNCPWNRCTFCPVYKGAVFSTRPPEHVKRDIDAVHRHTGRLEELAAVNGGLSRELIERALEGVAPEERRAFEAAASWFMWGMRSVFLQDANSWVVKSSDLVSILEHLRRRFPGIQRVTSYARAQTVAKRTGEELAAIAQAGLNRIHIGLESGSDKVLQMVKKGVTKAEHIEAGRRVIRAGMELSEYVMPGLGGKTLWEEHVIETADALNQINPHFIRLRTLAIPTHVPLYEECVSGRFEKCSEVMVAREIKVLLERLEGISSVIKSDHILNLFGDLEGTLPDDKPRMLAILKRFLDMSPERQTLYQVGRRSGTFTRLEDLDNPRRRAMAEAIRDQYGIVPDNVEAVIEDMMRTFI
jgi:hypothetical protein